ncbi:MAG: DUF4932 domain-containing protein [Bacteroidales bacterium]|nr:DUF4932 domain-containing protein [Bacteroidales bacterium]
MKVNRLKYLSISVLLMCNFTAKSAQVKVTVNSLNIMIDSRIELLNIIQYLGDYNLLNNYSCQYKNDINLFFGEYKNDEAVTFFRELAQNGFNYDAPVNVILYLSDSFNITQNIPEELVKRAGDQDKLGKFFTLCRKFSEKTNFYSFFEKHKISYHSLLDSVTSHLKKF